MPLGGHPPHHSITFVTSKRGKGPVFTVRLPQRLARAATGLSFNSCGRYFGHLSYARRRTACGYRLGSRRHRAGALSRPAWRSRHGACVRRQLVDAAKLRERPHPYQHLGDIHACVLRSTGALRIIDANKGCAPNERAIQWDQIGPAGPTGPVGPRESLDRPDPLGLRDSLAGRVRGTCGTRWAYGRRWTGRTRGTCGTRWAWDLLDRSDPRGLAGPAGPRDPWPAGPAGPEGPKGDPGPAPAIRVVTGTDSVRCGDDEVLAGFVCASGATDGAKCATPGAAVTGLCVLSSEVMAGGRGPILRLGASEDGA